MVTEIMERIRFTKMSGSGNDFIVIDNRAGLIDADRSRDLVRLACRRKLSVGADGLILIENDPEVDFKWRFFNADGSEAEMCGNGARCAARFAYLKGIVTRTDLSFRTLAGVIRAQISGVRVKTRMTPPHSMQTDFTLDLEQKPFCLHFVNTGVPHVVCLMESETALQSADIFNWGRGFRFHPRFQPAGSNVNFAVVRDPHHMSIRTYERGVEAETLACGTGSIAAALIAAAKGMATSPVDVQTMSGETLTIYFIGPSRQDTLEFEEVHLEGDARVVYEAELWEETLKE
jgi:diaminopimelate epimerase